MNRIVLYETGYGYIEIDGTKRIFCIYDFPMYSRIEVRGFCKNHNLIDFDRYKQPFFNTLIRIPGNI